MEEVSKMKRDMEIVTQHHLSRLLKLKAILKIDWVTQNEHIVLFII